MKIQKTLLWGLAAVGAASVIFYFVRKRKDAGATIAKAPGADAVKSTGGVVNAPAPTVNVSIPPQLGKI